MFVCVDGVFSLLADDLEWVWKLLSLCFGFSCITFSAVCGGLAALPVFFCGLGGFWSVLETSWVLSDSRLEQRRKNS